MPIRKVVGAAVPFLAGGAVALFFTKLARAGASLRGEPFPETWFREADHAPEHLWVGEPRFDWGD